MAKFRKKPVVIDAVQIVNTKEGVAELLEFCPVAGLVPAESPKEGLMVSIKTLEGIMLGGAGDWIIKGVAGEFYPCKPDIFEATYEPV